MKAKKTMVKCSQRLCNNLIRIRPNASLKKERYCRISCLLSEEKCKKREAEEMEKEKKESKARMTADAFELFSSIIDLIREDRMTEKLFERINKEIEKVK